MTSSRLKPSPRFAGHLIVDHAFGSFRLNRQMSRRRAGCGRADGVGRLRHKLRVARLWSNKNNLVKTKWSSFESLIVFSGWVRSVWGVAGVGLNCLTPISHSYCASWHSSLKSVNLRWAIFFLFSITFRVNCLYIRALGCCRVPRGTFKPSVSAIVVV